MDRMTGQEFEDCLRVLLNDLGYRVELTKITGDYGADLVLTADDGRRIVVQAKRWAGSVGNSAVQEAYAAQTMHAAHEAWGITNATFTRAAYTAARRTGVRLVDRWGLYRLLQERSQRVPAPQPAPLGSPAPGAPASVTCSPDGQWWWDGSRWVPRSLTAGQEALDLHQGPPKRDTRRLPKAAGASTDGQD